MKKTAMACATRLLLKLLMFRPDPIGILRNLFKRPHMIDSLAYVRNLPFEAQLLQAKGRHYLHPMMPSLLPFFEDHATVDMARLFDSETLEKYRRVMPVVD